MKHITTYIWLVPVFVLIQVLILNNIQFVSFINPFVYLVLIITLPQDTERWFLLIFSFFIGILLDLFEGNIGLNSSSLVFVSFLTPYLQRVIIPKNSIDEKDILSLQILGFKTFSVYALSIILIHHSYVFLLDHFSSNGILFLIFKILLSSIITYLIILIFQLFSFKTTE